MTLVAVTKLFPLPVLEAAYSAGLRHLGESRVQELAGKAASFEKPDLSWHLIGHLQRNKARMALEVFDLFHALDSLRLLRADGADLAYHDPVEPTLEHAGRDVRSEPLTDSLLAEAYAVLIVTDLRELDYGRVVAQSRIVVDTRNVTGPVLPAALRSQPQGWIVKCEE